MAELPIGFAVDDADGGSVGVVHSIFVDSATREPTWLIVAIGRRRSKLVAAPFADAAAAAGRVWVAHDRHTLREAPIVDPTRPLLREHEITICAHYRIGTEVGRAEAVASRPEGEVTSQPLGDEPQGGGSPSAYS
jgi:PRC-barrel domain